MSNFTNTTTTLSLMNLNFVSLQKTIWRHVHPVKIYKGQINESFCHCLAPAKGNFFFKFSIMICVNCVGKMLIWGHFHGIMELLLNNYLGHFLIIEKTFAFLFIEKAIKATPLLQAMSKCPGVLNATNRIGDNLNVFVNQYHSKKEVVYVTIGIQLFPSPYI